MDDDEDDFAYELDSDQWGDSYDREIYAEGLDDGDSSFVDQGDDDGENIGRGKKKDHVIEYKVHEMRELWALQEKVVHQLSSILGLSSLWTLMLLRHYRWQKERLIEAYMENGEEVLNEAGISLKVLRNKNESTMEWQRMITLSNFFCEICCEHFVHSIRTIALMCHHRFCFECYRKYLETKIEEGEHRKIKCPANCSLAVDDETMQIILPKEVFDKYIQSVMRTFITDHDYYKWCPAPNCDKIMECHVPSSSLNIYIPSVVCHCESSWCFGCTREIHQPSLCSLMSKWHRKLADDSETANWISVNTKECEKCHATIEKNGGCNHMICKQCRHEFCWVCLGPWSEHSTNWYKCNRYSEKSGEDARNTQARSRASLERYLHYYNRYINHETSARLDKELYARTEKKMEDMQATTDLSWIEVQFLRRAVDTLVECRMTLKYTYVFAYYLKHTNQTELFEENQRDLELAVEHLSELLEKPIDVKAIPSLKRGVLDKAVYVASRREILLHDCCKGLLEDRWEFNVDLNDPTQTTASLPFTPPLPHSPSVLCTDMITIPASTTSLPSSSSNE